MNLLRQPVRQKRPQFVSPALRASAKGQPCSLRLFIVDSIAFFCHNGRGRRRYQRRHTPNHNPNTGGSRMANKPIPSPEELRQHFSYDHHAGIIIRKSTGNRVCTTITSHGYRVFSYKNRQIYAHRAAWALHYGEWPNDVIDHINKDKQDNRIQNLRDVDNKTNLRNQRRSKANTSGITGVHYCKEYRLWAAQIRSDGENIGLGRYDTMAEARAARKAAEICLKFSVGHGEG